MPHIDTTVNLPSLIGWLIAGGTVIWYASRLRTLFEVLITQFKEHEAKDEGRYQEHRTELHSINEQVTAAKVEQAANRERFAALGERLTMLGDRLREMKQP